MSTPALTEEQIRTAVKNAYSIADFCRAVGWQPRGDNYKVFHKYVAKYKLDTSHFTGIRTNIGNRLKVGIPITEMFVKGNHVGSKVLKAKILREKLLEYKCSHCGISEWQGKPLSLQIHHKDGDHSNNELSNLEFICPNCHSQTDTFSGKKNSKGVCTRIHIPPRKHVCTKCGKAMHKKAKTGLCIECLRQSYKDKKLKKE